MERELPSVRDSAPPEIGGGPRPSPASGLRILQETSPERRRLLDADALDFLARLTRRFSSERDQILRDRATFRVRHRDGTVLAPLSETRGIRDSAWRVAPLPSDLASRRIELVGPVDRERLLRGLNSRADLYVADFEDSHSPTWEATLSGHLNLTDAVHRQLEHANHLGQRFRQVSRPAALMVRLRGLHLTERNVLYDGRPVSASLFDLALYLSHNVRELLRQGSAPYFELAGLEHHAEARLWDDVFRFSEDELGLPRGCVRASVSIESLSATFEMDEILHALRTRAAGLSARRWGYLFSFIKQFRGDPDSVLPDREYITTTSPLLGTYFRRLAEISHRRGVPAIGELTFDSPAAAEEPGEGRASVESELARARRFGFDAVSVARPALVPLVRSGWEIPLEAGPTYPWDRPSDPARLATPMVIPPGQVSHDGVRDNVHRSLRYLSSWFRGEGTVAVGGRVEDGGSTEFARAQLWQWIHHGVRTDTGRPVTAGLVRSILGQEVEAMVKASRDQASAEWAVRRSAQLLDELVTDPELVEFFTLRAYSDLERPNPTGGTPLRRVSATAPLDRT